MGKLLLDLSDGRPGANIAEGTVALTDEEAQELASDLEQLSHSREFVEASYFAVGVTRPEDEERVREIYLSARKRGGRSRSMPRSLWADFRRRLGINVPALHTKPTEQMSFSYFETMERRLLAAAGLSPRVIQIVMGLISSQEKAIDEIRRNKRRLEHGLIKHTVIDPLITWCKDPHVLADRRVPRDKIAAAMTVVADATVMYVT